jgi:thiamine-monophosphate kinase
MIDLSDGLSTDLHHICEQSGVGARIYAERIPSAAGAEGFALHGGEDYELLFTARPRVHVPAKIAGVPVTQLGEIIGARKVWLVQNGRQVPLHPGGWEHFRKS